VKSLILDIIHNIDVVE
jgi:dynein heavy chain 2, cytosolic